MGAIMPVIACWLEAPEHVALSYFKLTLQKENGLAV